ncbi:Nif11-like leader peptide family natural product precursor [Segetibacter sp.]|uniref:Nif11-like leader peptide family natural product precursor n=1 Tax=Segetibacter sp. TaxID=2231182 RepID=UPI002634DAEF|nr:Nif11-like leader peptide family natural product precursor [Segetibacter sp.]MCW3081696.1 hypothetical protein [Segetibacter sp.]
MADFLEAVKTDKNLQQQVEDALRQIAEKNGLTINEKQNNPSGMLGCEVKIATLYECTG